MMNTRFTIRPVIKEDESLTSYIMRLSRVNSMSFLDALKVTTLYNRIRRYSCELNLDDGFDQAHVTQFLNVPIEKMLAMTFTPLLRKLMVGKHFSSEQLKNYFPTLIETKKRVFCPVCLCEHGYFRLLWQVKGISMCDQHFCELQSFCNSCFRQQPFLSDPLCRLECTYCGTSLCLKEGNMIADQDKISKQKRKYEEWNYMLNPHKAILPEIPKVASEKVISFALLYAAQLSEQIFNKKLIQTKFRDDYIDSVLRYINDSTSSQYVTFSMLLSSLERVDVSIMDFARIRVPDSFLESVPTRKTVRKTVCLTPWCSSFGSNISMQKIKFPQTTFNNIEFTNRHLCTKCFIYYGFTQRIGQWREIGDNITIISNVRDLLRAGYTRRKIEQELSLMHLTVNEAVGYLAQHKLIEPVICEKYLPKSVPSDLVACFRKIVTQNGEKYKIAHKLFGWSQMDYFYYLASPEVQIYLALEGNRKHRSKKKSTVKIEWEKKVINELLNFKRLDKDISIKYIAKSLNCSAELLGIYGFRQLILQAQNEQKHQRRKHQESEYRQIVDEYLQTCLKTQEEVTVKKIYEILSRKRCYVQQYYSDLYKWIDEQVRGIKEKQRMEKFLKLQALAERTIAELHMSGKSTSTTNILRTIRVNNAQRDYPELLSFIKAVKITRGLV